MKYFGMAIGFVFLLSTSTFAYYGNLRCVVTDNGWEEHWGGHSSCDSCLSKHGDCTERCYEDEFEFTAEGRDYNGSIVRVSAAGMDEFRVRSEALDRCYESRLSGCQIVDDNKIEHLISKNRCVDNTLTCSVEEYFKRRPDVKASGMGAAEHYRKHGKREGMCRPI